MEHECIYCKHFFDCSKRSAKVSGCINFEKDSQEKIFATKDKKEQSN